MTKPIFSRQAPKSELIDLKKKLSDLQLGDKVTVQYKVERESSGHDQEPTIEVLVADFSMPTIEELLASDLRIKKNATGILHVEGEVDLPAIAVAQVITMCKRHHPETIASFELSKPNGEQIHVGQNLTQAFTLQQANASPLNSVPATVLV